MSKATIEAIRKAEIRADAIRAEAVKTAANMQKQAEADGKQLCAQTEKEASEENRQKILLIRKKANELMQKSSSDAVVESDTVRAFAKQKQHAAAKMVIRGITG